MVRPNLEALQKRCDDFNSRYEVGQVVIVRRDDNTMESTVTRSKAEVLSGHSAVIWLEGISGCYALDRVTPIVRESTNAPRCRYCNDTGYIRMKVGTATGQSKSVRQRCKHPRRMHHG